MDDLIKVEISRPEDDPEYMATVRKPWEVAVEEFAEATWSELSAAHEYMERRGRELREMAAFMRDHAEQAEEGSRLRAIRLDQVRSIDLESRVVEVRRSVVESYLKMRARGEAIPTSRAERIEAMERREPDPTWLADDFKRRLWAMYVVDDPERYNTYEQIAKAARDFLHDNFPVYGDRAVQLHTFGQSVKIRLKPDGSPRWKVGATREAIRAAFAEHGLPEKFGKFGKFGNTG